MTEQQAGVAAIAGVLGGMMVTFMAISVVLAVLLIIAHWKMFTKAGQPGWKSIIPIYSDYVLFDLVWDAKNFFIYLALCVCTYVLSMFTVNAQTGESNMLVSFLCLAGGIAALVWWIRLQLKTAAAYGKSTGFGVGLILLPNIFTLILGFGDAQYVGPQE